VSKRDIGASVRQRLLNQAHEQGRPFQELLQYFVMERFLYRLSKSKFRDSFILKGALLLTAWRAPQSRPTMDIDLMGRTDICLESRIQTVREGRWIESLRPVLQVSSRDASASCAGALHARERTQGALAYVLQLA